VATGEDGAEPGDPAELAGDLDVPALVERIERDLLGGPREFTRAHVADRAEVEPADARELWQALGFAAVDDDEHAFTAADIEAIGRVRELKADLGVDDDLLRAMTRMLGRSFSRLASWQGQLLIEMLSSSPDLLKSEDELIEFLDRLLTGMERIQSYVWRRQLAAYLSRVTSSAAGGGTTTMAVGFADMAAFTAFTRRSSEAELRTVLETFESVATDIVGAHRGQIVKTIGDEVLYVADDPRDGAEIALALVEAADQDERLPVLRVGLAAGPVVSRLGDVFGQTVNIASRLTSIARTGSILVDEGMAQALDGDGRYVLKSLRPTSVRGYHHLRSWRLRRAD